MDKKMRELLAAIEAKQNEAKAFLGANDTEKAQGCMNDIEELKKQYQIAEQLFEAEKKDLKEPEPDRKTAENSMTDDEKSFAAFFRGNEKSLSTGSNGAIIPATIANKIIEQVKELSPIYSRCTIYNVSGKLSIPVYGDDASDNVQAAYATEFTDLTAHAGKFISVDLNSIAVGAFSKIPKLLINNSDVDVLGFITQKIAEAISNFLEKELLVGTGAAGHMTGATNTTNLNTLTTKTLAGVTADVLIDTQLIIPEVYQTNSCWIMNKDLLKSIRKLKDNDGDYLMTRDFAAGFGWMLLGKPVYISETMPAVGTSTVPILYGDFSGLACKISKGVELQVLNEMFAAQHAVGVVGWIETDSKIENSQKFVGVKMSAS